MTHRYIYLPKNAFLKCLKVLKKICGRMSRYSMFADNVLKKRDNICGLCKKENFDALRYLFVGLFSFLDMAQKTFSAKHFV